MPNIASGSLHPDIINSESEHPDYMSELEEDT